MTSVTLEFKYYLTNGGNFKFPLVEDYCPEYHTEDNSNIRRAINRVERFSKGFCPRLKFLLEYDRLGKTIGKTIGDELAIPLKTIGRKRKLTFPLKVNWFAVPWFEEQSIPSLANNIRPILAFLPKARFNKKTFYALANAIKTIAFSVFAALDLATFPIRYFVQYSQCTIRTPRELVVKLTANIFTDKTQDKISEKTVKILETEHMYKRVKHRHLDLDLDQKSRTTSYRWNLESNESPNKNAMLKILNELSPPATY